MSPAGRCLVPVSCYPCPCPAHPPLALGRSECPLDRMHSALKISWLWQQVETQLPTGVRPAGQPEAPTVACHSAELCPHLLASLGPGGCYGCAAVLPLTCLNVSASWGREPVTCHVWISTCLCVPHQHGREGDGHILGGSKRLLGRPERVMRPALHAAPRPAGRAGRTSALTPSGAAPRGPCGALAFSIQPGPPAWG